MSFAFENIITPNQNVTLVLPKGISLTIKREDLLHPFVSGNKFRKLKYNLIEAQNQNHKTVLTFGGAYSNHIAAVAYAAQALGFQSIGVIRGDELVSKIEENPTLSFAKKSGMQFEFVSRETYRERNSSSYLNELESKHPPFYLIPEGGTNELAVQGCEEIITPADTEFNYICCAVGTGGTIAGLINSSLPHQKVLGFPALKADYLQDEICIFAKKQGWKLLNNYHFGGYGKVTTELIQFINDFLQQTNIPLDPIYTGKMIYGILDLIENDYFPEDSKILAIHTGGLQGIEGMNQKLTNKNLLTLTTHG